MRQLAITEYSEVDSDEGGDSGTCIRTEDVKYEAEAVLTKIEALII